MAFTADFAIGPSRRLGACASFSMRGKCVRLSGYHDEGQSLWLDNITRKMRVKS